MKFSKKLCKLLSAFLIVCLFLNYSGMQQVFAASSYKTVEIDGVSYTYKISENKYTIINNDTHKKLVIKINKKSNSINYKEYKYKNKKYVKTISKTTKIKNNATMQANYSNDNKVTCKWPTKEGNKYWFNISTSKPKYVKIGCVKSYQINYNKNKDDLKTYMNAINNCNKNYNKSAAILGFADFITLSAILVVVAAGTVLTEGALLAILGVDCAFAGDGIKEMVECYGDYCEVKQAYQILK